MARNSHVCVCEISVTYDMRINDDVWKYFRLRSVIRFIGYVELGSNVRTRLQGGFGLVIYCTSEPSSNARLPLYTDSSLSKAGTTEKAHQAKNLTSALTTQVKHSLENIKKCIEKYRN